MDLCQEANLYPEGCDEQGMDCVQCIRRTAEATRSLTASPAPEWARAVFQKMYTHPACRQMEHTFVWACGSGELVQVGAVAAA